MCLNTDEIDLPLAYSFPHSLYVHIPFCETKCPYCDFNTYSRIEPMLPSYLEALRLEIEIWGDMLRSPLLSTVFFGGGTPSYIPVEGLNSILNTVASSFNISEGVEITLESNPGDLNESTLRNYLDAGVSRLSIGVQSFNDQMLKLLGRRHTSDQAVQAFEAALKAGFTNVSIDLMYGLPYQTMETWSETLNTVKQLDPHHISLYALTLEEGTPMENWVASGRMTDPDPDLAADMYLLAEDRMDSLGYCHYEISNWSKPGFQSEHNLTYWKNLPYLGVGPGAHSYISDCRFQNIRSPREYITRLEVESRENRGSRYGFSESVSNDLDINYDASEVVSFIESVPVVEKMELVDNNLEMAETMMMGLRLSDGINLDNFAYRFGISPDKVYGIIIDQFVSDGLLEIQSGCIRLTGKGRLLGNEVFSSFFQ